MSTIPALRTLKQQLKEKTLCNVLLLYGEEQYLKKTYFTLIKNALVAPDDILNYIKLEAKDMREDELFSVFDSVPVLADRRLVNIVDLDISALSEQRTEMYASLITGIPEDTTVVFTLSAIVPDERKASFKRFVKAVEQRGGLCIKFEQAAQTDLVSWVSRHFAAANKRVDNDTIRYLLDCTDNQMQNLKNEIDKLCAYASTDQITRRHIDAVVTKTLDAKIYEISDAFLNNDPARLYGIIDELIRMKFEIIQLSSTVFHFFIGLYTVKCAKECGLDTQGIGKELKMKDFVVKKYLRSGLTKQQAGQCIELCVQLDKALKSSSGDKRVLFEKMFADMLVSVKSY